MADNLYRVLIHSPKGKPERERQMRLMSGQFTPGESVTLTPDVLPFKPKRFIVIDGYARDKNGVIIKVRVP